MPWFLPMLASSALGAGSALLQGAINRGNEAENIERQFRANRELAEFQYSKDLEMWRRNNEYNSPQSQMERLKAAGLNPNLVYGSGAVSGNTSGATPKYSEAPVDRSMSPIINLPQMLSAFQDMRLKTAQIDNVEAQTAAINQRALNDSITSGILMSKQTTAGAEAALAETKAMNRSELMKFQLEAMRLRNESVSKDLLTKGLGLSLMQTRNEKTRAEIARVQSETLFNSMRNDWMKMGVTTSDNPLVRIMTRMLSTSGIMPDWDWTKNLNFTRPKKQR